MNRHLRAAWNFLPLKFQLVAVGLALLLVFASVSAIYSKYQSNKAHSQIERLESANRLANDKILILEGQVQSLYTQLDSISKLAIIADANLQTSSKETANAKTRYIEVRNSGPTFNSPTNSGKVAELTGVLDALYPNSTSPH